MGNRIVLLFLEWRFTMIGFYVFIGIVLLLMFVGVISGAFMLNGIAFLLLIAVYLSALRTNAKRLQDDTPQTDNSLPRAVKVERRGRPPQFRTFDSVQNIKETLDDALRQQQESALAKQQRHSQWGTVGDIESAAVKAARQRLDTVPKSQPPDSYAKACHTELGQLIVAYRNDPKDADGYSLGTIYAISKCLLE